LKMGRNREKQVWGGRGGPGLSRGGGGGEK